MYTVKVNGDTQYEIKKVKGALFVNDEPVEIDQTQLNAHSAHVLFKNSSFTLELVSIDYQEKLATIKVNSNIYKVSVEDQFDQLLKQLGMDNLSSSKVQQVKAPMPGLVLNVLVAEGEEVKKGDSLLVLEAMKMENMIKSPADGIVKKVTIKAGDKVEKNEVLIGF